MTVNKLKKNNVAPLISVSCDKMQAEWLWSACGASQRPWILKLEQK